MSYGIQQADRRYTFTETGYSLKPVQDAMWAWGADYQAKNG